jgi:hypothetical protein
MGWGARADAFTFAIPRSQKRDLGHPADKAYSRA